MPGTQENQLDRTSRFASSEATGRNIIYSRARRMRREEKLAQDPGEARHTGKSWGRHLPERLAGLSPGRKEKPEGQPCHEGQEAVSWGGVETLGSGRRCQRHWFYSHIAFTGGLLRAVLVATESGNE